MLLGKKSFNIDYKTVSDQDEIADSFNSFVANIGYKVNNSVLNRWGTGLA